MPINVCNKNKNIKKVDMPLKPKQIDKPTMNWIGWNRTVFKYTYGFSIK